mmetsp:Transcript_1987/g.4487  ORF Transcript_1987/g.4487 Transcript_1987/m.4487 type:complete len:405 (-) Transcript_1987:328-1542(-)
MYIYDANRGHLATAVRLAHTVVPQVLGRLEFWGFFALHIVITILFRLDIIPEFQAKGSIVRLDWNDVKVTTAITIFFEVFYTNTCFTRYLKFYEKTRKLLVDVIMVIFDLRLYLKALEPQHARLTARYFLASLLLFFHHVNIKRKVVSLQKWEETLQSKLILPEEQAFLRSIQSSERALIVLHWSTDVFVLGHSKARLPNNIMKAVVEKLQKAFMTMQELEDTLHLPVPFQYFHLLNLMVCVNLVLWAYSMGAAESTFGIVVYFFSELIFMGMMELASMLADPYGDDDVDFPVSSWLQEFFEKAVQLLEYSYTHGSEVDGWDSVLKAQGPLDVTLTGSASHPQENPRTGLLEGGQGWVSANSWKANATVGGRRDGPGHRDGSLGNIDEVDHYSEADDDDDDGDE